MQVGFLPDGNFLFNGDIARDNKIYFVFEPSFPYKAIMRKAMQSITRDMGIQFVKGKGQGNNLLPLTSVMEGHRKDAFCIL